MTDFDEKTRVTQVVQPPGPEEGDTGNDCVVVIYTKEPGLLGKRFVLDRNPTRIGRGAQGGPRGRRYQGEEDQGGDRDSPPEHPGIERDAGPGSPERNAHERIGLSASAPSPCRDRDARLPR